MRRCLVAIAFAGTLGGVGPLAAADRPDAGTPSPPPSQQSTTLTEWEREVLAHIELLLDLEVIEDLDLLSQLEELSLLSEGESR